MSNIFQSSTKLTLNDLDINKALRSTYQHMIKRS